MDISVIIPLHEWNDKVDEFYHNAIETVSVQDGIEGKRDVFVVYAASIEDDFGSKPKKEFKNLNVITIKNEGKTDFQSQINLAAKEVKTKWFSILEYDDEYSKTYFKKMNEYISSPEFKDVELFLPIIVETNDKDQAMKLTNETVWSKQFVGENGTMGYLNKDSLNNYTDFKICGGLFRTDEFNTAGGLKTNIKLTFQYEFLLRYLNNASKIYTVPKTIYKHLVLREGSLFDNLSKTMSMQERKFWFDTAKKESNFFNDRPIDLSQLSNSEEVATTNV